MLRWRGLYSNRMQLDEGGLAGLFWHIFIFRWGDIGECNSIGTNSHLCEKAKQSGLSCSKETDLTHLFGGDY